jgi:hypothetical protein
MRCNSCSVVVLAGSAPGERSGRRGQGRAGPQVARLLHRDEFDDQRVGTVIFLVRNLEERRDDHRIGIVLLRGVLQQALPIRRPGLKTLVAERAEVPRPGKPLWRAATKCGRQARAARGMQIICIPSACEDRRPYSHA